MHNTTKFISQIKKLHNLLCQTASHVVNHDLVHSWAGLLVSWSSMNNTVRREWVKNWIEFFPKSFLKHCHVMYPFWFCFISGFSFFFCNRLTFIILPQQPSWPFAGRKMRLKLGFFFVIWVRVGFGHEQKLAHSILNSLTNGISFFYYTTLTYKDLYNI